MSGKRLVNAYKTLDKNQEYSLKEAVKIVKENAKAKFDETIDLAINLGVDPKHADQMIRGVCQLPHGNGKTVRVAVFAQAVWQRCLGCLCLARRWMRCGFLVGRCGRAPDCGRWSY